MIAFLLHDGLLLQLSLAVCSSSASCLARQGTVSSCMSRLSEGLTGPKGTGHEKHDCAHPSTPSWMIPRAEEDVQS